VQPKTASWHRRTHRSWLIIGGSAAAILTAMIAWLAYGNATSVRTLPQSAVMHAVVPPPDNSMLTQSVPSLSIQAPQAAAIVEEAPAERPGLVMLPREQREVAKPAPEVREPGAAPVREAPASSKPAIDRTAAAPKQLARPAKVAATQQPARAAAPKKAKVVPAATAEIDSDVALLSAILAHSSRHAAERAQQESCRGKKCPPKAAAQP
jgi:hypothetical protein